MNTPAQYDQELRCAEYALGLLDTETYRAFEQTLHADPALQEMLARWQRHFASLAEDIAPREVPARVWLRIQHDLGFLPERSAQPAGSGRIWWNNLTLWRWLGAGASVAALALLAVDLSSLHRPPPAVTIAANGYMVTSLAAQGGPANWTATIDMHNARMVVVPANSPKVASNRSTELWLIPPHAKPIPLGVFATDHPASLALAPEVLAQVDEQALLAVSVEPLGGSPTGQPTGPVIATGTVHQT